MITVTQQARNSLRMLLNRVESSVGLRLAVSGDLPGLYAPSLIPIKESEVLPEDVMVECQDLRVYLAPGVVQKAKGLNIDIKETPFGPRLIFEFPTPEWDDPLAAELQNLLDKTINPALQRHGGSVALLEVKDGAAEIIMGGGCQGCALASQTLSQGVEAAIKREIPEIHTVIDRTDHLKGENPYYEHSIDEGKSKASRSARRRLRRGRR